MKVRFKNLDKLHESIQKDNDVEVQRILEDLYMRWFAFGLGLGITITCLFFGWLGYVQKIINL